MPSENEIRSIPCPACRVCGAPGVLTYEGLSDRLFATPGLWDLKQCPNPLCGVMWLDPMPLEQDINKAYQSYYTHGKNSPQKSQSEKPLVQIFTCLFRLFLRLTPIHSERKNLDRMFLWPIRRGKLLEVGCGDGSRLSRLADFGWSVEGQEVDPVSAAIAQKTSIKIHLGPLENLALQHASYDAIVMNHVIEHVHDPVKLLIECHRLLKKQGTFVVVTPNVRSYGHRVFKSNWRGLEPPRHILLHSRDSLRQVALKAGFKKPEVWTMAANASHFTLGSLQIIHGQNEPESLTNAFHRYVIPTLFLFMERIVQIFDRDSGEECVLMARK